MNMNMQHISPQDFDWSSVQGNLSQIDKGEAGTKKNKDMGQADFMKLFVAEIQHQNPMEPKEGSDFMGQLAQFGTVDGLNKLQKSVQELSQTMLASRALDAASLIDHSVMVSGDNLVLEGTKDNQGNLVHAAKGAVDVPVGASNIIISIEKNGQLVHQFTHQSAPAGDLEFSWDGIDMNQKMHEPGDYKVTATAVMDKKRTGLKTWTSAKVNSISLIPGGGEARVNIKGVVGSKNLSDIRKIS